MEIADLGNYIGKTQAIPQAGAHSNRDIDRFIGIEPKPAGCRMEMNVELKTFPFTVAEMTESGAGLDKRPYSRVRKVVFHKQRECECVCGDACNISENDIASPADRSNAFAHIAVKSFVEHADPKRKAQGQVYFERGTDSIWLLIEIVGPLKSHQFVALGWSEEEGLRLIVAAL